MILEVAILHVIPGKESQFEADFQIAGQYISSIPGYIRHSLPMYRSTKQIHFAGRVAKIGRSHGRF